MANDLLNDASSILAAGRKAQSGRMKTITENIANANSTAQSSSSDPYRRKIAVFEIIDDKNNEDIVGRILRDTSDFRSRYEPSNPTANTNGYVKLPNVDVNLEHIDFQMATRLYEINLNASSAIDRANQATIDLLK